MKFEEFIEEIDSLLYEKKYEEALKRIDEKIKEREDEKLWMVKGSILMDINEIEEAIKCFDKALEINENNDIALAFKGVAFYKINMLNEAEKIFDKALQLNEKNFTALYWKGAIEGRKGNIKEEVELKGKSAFILFATGGDYESFGIFREVYYSNVDIPVRYECGVAYASMLEYILALKENKEIEKEYEKIISNCWENKDKMCKSAQILLEDMMGRQTEEIVVNDEKDFVFKKLKEG